MGKGAVRRPSFLSPGPTAVRAFFFSLPSGLPGLCRRSAGLLRGRLPGRAPLRLQFSCVLLSPVSCLRALLRFLSSCTLLSSCAFPCRTDGGLHLLPPLYPVASPSRVDDEPHLLPLFRVEQTAGRTSCRLSVQPPFRVEPTAGLHLPPPGYPTDEWPYSVRQSSVVHPAFCFIP